MYVFLQDENTCTVEFNGVNGFCCFDLNVQLMEISTNKLSINLYDLQKSAHHHWTSITKYFLSQRIQLEVKRIQAVGLQTSWL